MSEASVLACAEQFCLRLPRMRARGPQGERMGSGVGSSLEFQDYRGYVAGDDLRHVDWAAFARSDELLVRLYREEIAPYIEVVVDTSASMTSTPEKEQRLRDLLSLLVRLSRADRFTLTLWFVGRDIERIARDQEERVRDLEFAGAWGLERCLKSPPMFHKNGIRVVLSDLLFPAESAPIVRRLGHMAARLSIVQLLDAEERDPGFFGGHRLDDVETGHAVDIIVSSAARRAYVRRLDALTASWRVEANRLGGDLATVTAQDALADIAAGPLRRSGLLGVRGVESGA